MLKKLKIEDLKNKIGYLLKNQDLVIKMGKKARKFIEEKFNSEIHYEKLMKIYSRVMNK